MGAGGATGTLSFAPPARRIASRTTLHAWLSPLDLQYHHQLLNCAGFSSVYALPPPFLPLAALPILVIKVAFNVDIAFNASEECAAAISPRYANMRLLTVGHTTAGAPAPTDELTSISLKWSLPTTASVCQKGNMAAGFSAVCFFTVGGGCVGGVGGWLVGLGDG